MPNELIKWDKIRYQIETSKDIETLTGIKNKLRAYQILAEQSKQSQEVQSKIAIYKARADRKCGEWLKGNIKQGQRSDLSQDATSLKELGVNRSESSRLQKIADIPENKFENILQEAEEQTKKITNNMLVNIAREAEKKERNNNLKPVELPKEKFNILYIDPPWKYDKDEAYFGQDVQNHYPVMDEDEIYALPVKKLSAKDCVLYLWTTAPKLNIGIKAIEAWGFDYKTCLIWDKVKHNMGYYASIRHEILLIGGRGSSAPTNKKFANQIDSVYVEERTKHSQKPDYFYEIIEKKHPNKTKRIELFARDNKKRQGWTYWGSEANT